MAIDEKEKSTHHSFRYSTSTSDREQNRNITSTAKRAVEVNSYQVQEGGQIMSWFGDFARNRKEITRLRKENEKLDTELNRMKHMFAGLRDKHDKMKKAIKKAVDDA